MEDFSFFYPRYLQAKESVDARALNRSVWTTFLRTLDRRFDAPVLLEVGGGTGATLRRFLKTLPQQSVDEIHYTLLDSRADNLETARDRTLKWARENGFRTHETSTNAFQLQAQSGTEVTVRLIEADLFDYARREARQFDAVLAQAVADLYDTSEFLDALNTSLTPGGLWYLPIHFDGTTAFEPAIDPALDAKIVDRYHESIESPHAGRSLLTELRDVDAQLLRTGSSDWIVHSTATGYPDQEAYFLKCILHFVREEIHSNNRNISMDKFTLWMGQRWSQVEQGTLIYIAHQLDICAEKQK